MGITHYIDTLDKSIIWWFNDHQTPILDTIMIFFSHRFMPIPLYIFFLFLLFKNFNWKQVLFAILPTIVLVILLADGISSKIFKPWIARLRPCYELIDLNLPNGCGGQYGFFSSHAANSFAVATLLFILMRNKVKNIGWIVYSWASIVSFSRIYISVHYPSDILAGAVCGILIGSICSWICSKFLFKEFLT